MRTQVNISAFVLFKNLSNAHRYWSYWSHYFIEIVVFLAAYFVFLLCY